MKTNLPHHIETSHLVCSANWLTGFYMMGNICRYRLMSNWLTFISWSIMKSNPSKSNMPRFRSNLFWHASKHFIMIFFIAFYEKKPLLINRRKIAALDKIELTFSLPRTILRRLLVQIFFTSPCSTSKT